MIAADIERIARRGTIAISALAAEVYRDRPAPQRADVTVKTVLCRLRREKGVPVHLHQGFVTIGTVPKEVPLSAGPWAAYANAELTDLDMAVLKVLRTFGTVAVSAREIASDCGYDGEPARLRGVMRRLVAKGFAIDQVGRAYRLARCRP